MNLYRQAIVFFGVVIPLLCGVAVIGVGYIVKSRMFESYQTKLESFRSNQRSEVASKQIEMEIKEARPHLERWTAQLSMETASTVSTTLRSVTEKLPNKEIQQTSFELPQTTTGFGQVSSQDSAHIRMAYRGTYRTLQKAFLELETRLPQLQLQEMKFEPMGTSSSLLNFQVTYTAWEIRKK